MSASAIVTPAPVTAGAQTTYTVAMENYLDAKLQIDPGGADVAYTLCARLEGGETAWSEPIASGTARTGAGTIVHVPTNYAELRLDLTGDAKVLVRLTNRLPN